MQIIQLSDIHGELKYISKFAEDISNASLVIVSGDLSSRGDRKSAERVLSEIEKLNSNILAVHGNWDRNEVEELISERGYFIHSKGTIIDNIGFFGIGGSNKTPMKTPSEYSEDELSIFLEKGYEDIKNCDIKVLISHCPPKKMRDRTFLGLRAGSSAVRDFVLNRDVHICLCGHIHEARGAEIFNNILVANSGAFKSGRFIELNITSNIKNSIEHCKIEKGTNKLRISYI